MAAAANLTVLAAAAIFMAAAAIFMAAAANLMAAAANLTPIGYGGFWSDFLWPVSPAR